MIPGAGLTSTSQPTLRAAIAVAAGGAVGAGARWAVGEVLGEPGIPGIPDGWPWATLIVNVVGCLAIGFAAQRVERGTPAWDGLVTGVLGGFTTMSALAVELNDFVDDGRGGAAMVYAAATFIGGGLALLVAERRGTTSVRSSWPSGPSSGGDPSSGSRP